MRPAEVDTYVRRVIDLYLEAFEQGLMPCLMDNRDLSSSHNEITEKLREELMEDGITEQSVLVTWNSVVNNYYRCREQNKDANYPYFEMIDPHFKDMPEEFIKRLFWMELCTRERILNILKIAGKLHMVIQLVFLAVYLLGISVNVVFSDTSYITHGSFIMAGTYFMYLHVYSYFIALSAVNGRTKTCKALFVMIPITSALLLFLQAIAFSSENPILEISTNATVNDWESSFNRFVNLQCPVPLHVVLMVHSVLFTVHAIWTYSNTISLGSRRPVMRKCLLMLHLCNTVGMVAFITMLFGLKTFYLFFIVNAVFTASFIHASMTTNFKNERLYAFGSHAILFKYY